MFVSSLSFFYFLCISIFVEFDLAQEYEFLEQLPEKAEYQSFVVLEFTTPVVCRDDALVIGSRLDTDFHSNSVCLTQQRDFSLKAN